MTILLHVSLAKVQVAVNGSSNIIFLTFLQQSAISPQIIKRKS